MKKKEASTRRQMDYKLADNCASEIQRSIDTLHTFLKVKRVTRDMGHGEHKYLPTRRRLIKPGYRKRRRCFGD
jgi:hypothetical protein